MQTFEINLSDGEFRSNFVDDVVDYTGRAEPEGYWVLFAYDLITGTIKWVLSQDGIDCESCGYAGHHYSPPWQRAGWLIAISDPDAVYYQLRGHQYWQDKVLDMLRTVGIYVLDENWLGLEHDWPDLVKFITRSGKKRVGGLGPF